MTRSAGIPLRLPLLDALVAERVGDRQPLRGTAAILVQHQTATIVAMVQTLLRLGLDPERCHIIDIPYSAHPAVRAALNRLGVPTANFAPSDFRMGVPLASYQLRRATEAYSRVRRTLPGGDRLLLIDDGGYLMQAASSDRAPQGRIAVVEQTVFGIRKVREHEAVAALAELVPIVNVAESHPKKTLEATFLGEAICQALARCSAQPVERMRQGATLLLGYGAIGSAVARALCADHAIPAAGIWVHDPDEDALGRAHADGFQTWSRDAGVEHQFDVVIGCSGRAAFRPEDGRFVVDGAILASGSSGAIEFGTEELLSSVEDLAARDVHEALTVDLLGREVVVLNGGFPVDFDGTLEPVPARLIQLTRALMVGGALQAMSSACPGVKPLNRDFSRWVERRFLEMRAG
jgi:S-adenosylhomocysteine hydrolase